MPKKVKPSTKVPKGQIAVYLKAETIGILQRQAIIERRSVSGLAAVILEKALSEVKA